MYKVQEDPAQNRAVEDSCPHCGPLYYRPPFYAVQMDIAYGFSTVPCKKARNKVPLYALVIVCILSSATSILSLEGLECQDVVAALERHSAHHGVPAVLYVDNGPQLVYLEGIKFTPQDLENDLRQKLDLRPTRSEEEWRDGSG